MSITEIVKMKVLKELDKDEFVKIVDKLEKNFHSVQNGFIDSELLYHEEENEWYMIQHWETKNELIAASKKIFSDKNAQKFVESLDKKSVSMLIFPRIKSWEKTNKV